MHEHATAVSQSIFQDCDYCWFELWNVQLHYQRPYSYRANTLLKLDTYGLREAAQLWVIQHSFERV